MKTLLIVLMSVMLPVFAGHHRDHVGQHLDTIEGTTTIFGNLNTVLGSSDLVLAYLDTIDCSTYGTILVDALGPELTATEACLEMKSQAKQSAYHAEQLDVRIQEVRDILFAGDARDLDTARRIINQPRSADAPQRSALRSSFFMLYTAIQASRRGLEVNALDIGPYIDLTELNRGMTYMSLVWDAFDRADWHIVDAIREELYFDPAFGE